MKKERDSSLIRKVKKKLYSILMAFLAAGMVLSNITVPTKAADEYQGTVSIGTQIKTNIQLEGLERPGNVWTLSINGTPALCMDHYTATYEGAVYTRYSADSVSPIAVKSLRWYNASEKNNVNYVVAQVVTWGGVHGVYSDLTSQTAYNFLDRAMVDIIGESIWEVLKEAQEALGLDLVRSYLNQINGQNASTSGIYLYDNGVNQPVITTNPGTALIRPRIATLNSTRSATESVTVTVTKTDDITSQPLQGVTFDFYRDDVLLKSNVITNSNGQASASYTNTHTATSDVFRYCTNWNEISEADRNTLTAQGVYSSQSAAQAAADAQAQQRADALANVSHTYKAVETSTRNEYYLNASASTVSNSITGSGNVTLTLTNHRQTGSITITKYDSETNQTVAGAIYELYAAEDIIHPDGKTGTVYTNGQLVATFPATGSNGQATLNDLYLGDYTIVEKTAPDKYVVSETRYNVSLTYAGQNVSVTTASQNVFDEVQRGTIEISKNDKELYNGTQNADTVDGNNDGAQGDATLEGAVYGLYARNSITHPDGKTGTITYNSTNGHLNEVILSKGTDLTVYSNSATAGTLIATAKTDKNGEIKFDHLYLGDYFIKEITPSEGYLLDETQYNVSLTYAGQTVEVATASQDVVEQVKKQAFDLYKGGHTAGTSTNATPLEGVHFEVKLESDIQALVAQGMSLEEAKTASPLYDELITDENGQASSIELPYGTYRVMETVPAEDYNTADDFFVTVTEDSREHQSFTNNVIIDEVFTSYLKLVKKDAETGKTVLLPNTEFKIRTLQDIYVAGREIKANEYVGYFTWNPFQGFWVDEWTTDESGTVMLNEMLPAGDYELVEINAPEGYLLNNEVVEFTISNTKTDMMETAADGNPIITVNKEDTSVKGQITVYKEGEMLTGVQQNEDGSYSFIYEVLPQSNTEFQIVADADILDPSNDGTVLYEKDEIVETITTGSDGYATSSELPLGAYRVEEIKVQDGMVLNKEIKKVTLEYEDQTVEVVYGEASFLNERQKIELNISKADSDTEKPLAGATFGLYAAEDILDYQGDLLLEKDTLIETSVSDKDGKIIFDADLPLYKYYVKEIEAPIGYATTDEVFSIDGSYQGQDIAVIKAEKIFENDITQVEVSKKDITTKDELPGATLAIYPADADGNPILGECFETWVSTTEPHIVKGLEINTYYVLRETVAPFENGFVTSQDVLFFVEDIGEVQTVEMWDDVTKVEFSKTDAATGELIGGAILAVYPVDENGNILKGECFETWLTVAGETHTIYQLPVGNYVLVEEVAPFDAGYVTAEPVYFEVKDTSDIQQVVMEDDHTKVEFTKTDITTGEPVVGAQLAVIPLDENGEPKLGETFETWITDENPHLIEYLPIGDYILRETVAPFDAGYVTAEDVRFTVDNTGIVQKVEMQDDHTKVEISKLDPDGGFVEDAVLQIIPVLEDGTLDEGAAFETFITDEDSHLIEYLPIGTYVLRELTAPEGYVKASDILFEVKDTADVQSVEMTNKQVTVSKVDIAGEEIEGASMKVVDEEGNVVDEWTSGKEPYAISGLEVGKTYTLIEDLAPVGYYIADSIEFTVEDNGLNQHIDMVDELKIATVHVNKVDAQTGQAILSKEFAFTLYSDAECTEEILTVAGNTIDGYAEFDLTYGIWFIKETSAPEGYLLSDEIVKVEFNDDGLFVNDELVEAGEDGYYSIIYLNQLMPVIHIPDTGDNSHIAEISLAALLSGAGMILLILLKRRKEEMN